MSSGKIRTRKIAHAVLGDVTVDPADGVYWEKEVSFGGRGVHVALTIDDAESVTPKLLDWGAKILTTLSELDQAARTQLRSSYDEEDDDESPVRLYMSHHLDEFDAKTVKRIFGKPKKSVDFDIFLAAIGLVGVSIYPADVDGRVTFDYSVGAAETSYILTVSFDDEGNATSVEMES